MLLEVDYTDRLPQFASQLAGLSREERDTLESAFLGTESRDYYRGQLAAMANACAILGQLAPEEAKCVIGQLVSFLAYKVLEGNIQTERTER